MATNITRGRLAYGTEISSIKTRVKTELSRRWGQNSSSRAGDVSSYAGSAYDYSTAANRGNKILIEHANKIIQPINAVANSGIGNKNSGDSLTAAQIVTLEQKLALYESDTPTGSSTHCSASCTGLCSGSCNTGCTSCTGSCVGGCLGACGSGCASGCTGCSGCSGCGGCSSGCGTTCGGHCTAMCADNCYGCSGSCVGDCGTTCGSAMASC